VRDAQKQRDAKKRWYEEHREVYLERNRRKRADLMQEIRAAKEKPCADCGGESATRRRARLRLRLRTADDPVRPRVAALSSS
jgi:hypothetical protein